MWALGTSHALRDMVQAQQDRREPPAKSAPQVQLPQPCLKELPFSGSFSSLASVQAVLCMEGQIRSDMGFNSVISCCACQALLGPLEVLGPLELLGPLDLPEPLETLGPWDLLGSQEQLDPQEPLGPPGAQVCTPGICCALSACLECRLRRSQLL